MILDYRFDGLRNQKKVTESLKTDNEVPRYEKITSASRSEKIIDKFGIDVDFNGC